MNKKRNRNGFRSGERGKNSLRYLKNKYENTENRSSYDLAKDLIEKNIPEPLKCLTPILARLAVGETRRNELGLACKMAGKLVVYKIEDMGYGIREKGCRAKKDVNKYRTVLIWKNFSDKRNIFEIINYEVTYPNKEAEKLKQEFETDFFNLYGLRIKFSSPTKR